MVFVNHHRVWLLLVLIGAVFCALLLSFVLYTQGNFLNNKTPSQTADSIKMIETYKKVFHETLSAYDQSSSREQLLASLLAMRVPTDYLEAHIDLVLLADDIDFSEQALRDQINNIRTTYAWLQ